jgi:hypothetical protein
VGFEETGLNGTIPAGIGRLEKLPALNLVRFSEEVQL